MYDPILVVFFFFFNDTATTEIYTLSLHDALPICGNHEGLSVGDEADVTEEAFVEDAIDGFTIVDAAVGLADDTGPGRDRKSTRLNSSHSQSRMPSSA